MENDKPSEHKLRDLIQGIRFAMLTTRCQDGSLHSRPMACVQDEDEHALWFFTARSSGKVAAIRDDEHVNLAFSDPAHNRFVSVAGRAETIDDSRKEEQLWSPLFKTWFPNGLQDPELILMKVRVESAEYWDAPAGKFAWLA